MRIGKANRNWKKIPKKKPETPTQPKKLTIDAEGMAMPQLIS
jgi:hypothetical protein